MGLSRQMALAAALALCGCSEQPPTRVSSPAAPERPRAPAAPVDERAERTSTLLEIIEGVFGRLEVPARDRPVYLALAHLESNFTVDQVSPAGAVGLFQITTGTANAILEAHPRLDPRTTPIYNPVLEDQRRLLVHGAAGRYPLRVLRLYAKHLRRAREARRREKGADDTEALKALDARFDPQTNATLAVFHLEQLRRGYFGRRRCYRYRGREADHRGKRLCGAFSGRQATLLAAAGYHLGVGAVENMLAVSQARSIAAYVESLRRSRQPMYRRNHYYIAKLRRLSRRYVRLLRSGVDRGAVARAFPGQPALPRRLFRRFAVAAVD